MTLMLKLKVLPVHSAPAEERVVARGLMQKPPSFWQLSKHQLDTLQAINRSECNVIFNVAMTGDGKSLAAYLPALMEDRPTLAMYPTNELIRDQQRQVESYQRLLGTDRPIGVMFSEKLYEIRSEFDLDVQAKAIDWQTWQKTIVLTNPDIFNLIANFCYVSEHQNPDALLQRILERFDLFIFDEFHVYDAPQVSSVLTSLLYVLEQSRNLPMHLRKKFLFLSATPSPMLVECLQRAGVTPTVIQGCYDYSDSCPDGWRTILQPAQLHFHSVGRQTEKWVRDNWTLIAEWFVQHPHSRGAIIVNSVAIAKRLVEFFNELRQAGKFSLTVAENTGLHKDPLEADLVVGTSTIDVGVDFKINFLIFEALDAGTWIQRLGRLGRHKGYETPEGQWLEFDAYCAHSLLPRYSYERVETRLPGIGEIDRAQLYALVRGDETAEGIFSPVNDFRHYQRCWGWLSPTHVLNTLGHPRLRENYARTSKRLGETYSAVWGLNIKEREKWYFYLHEHCKPIVEEAVIKFRGETPFDCGILDETDGEVKIYDLLWVLRNADVRLMRKDDFLREVEHRGLNTTQFKYVDMYLHVRRYLEESERAWLNQRKAIHNEFGPDDYRKPHVLKGFQVDGAGGLRAVANAINRVVECKPLLCLISPMRCDELRARLRLPTMFPLQRLLDCNGNEFSVAFSKEALLLSSQPIIFGGGHDDANAE